ncbi:MAG: response regulator [Deltaproteobacteria bacterium]|nr:response regulator [Deltaproteobacteria bacterium]
MNLEIRPMDENKKFTLVIVDDERSILTELNILLKRRYDVHAFENPEEVETFIDNHQVDLIICDELMPEMRGSILLSRLHKKHPDICKLVLSGQAEKNDIVRAINEGHIFSFLFKPVNQQQLLNVIEKGLENRMLKLTLKRQNIELKNYSENLEKMVQERTAQLVRAHERVKQLDGNKMSFLIYLTNEINSPLDRIQKLAETLLTYFGLAGSNLKPNMRMMPLQETLAGLLRSRQKALESRAVTVEERLAADMSVKSDPEYLERVLGVIMDNAIIFSNEGGKVVIEAGQHDGKTTITVTDSGKGIDPTDLENIFKAFILEPEKRRPAGFGLNLPLAGILVNALGGRLWATSAGPGTGAAFHLEL